MKNGRVLRSILALAAGLTFSAAGVLTFASEASAAGTLTVTPNSGLQPQGSTVVSVSGSGFTPSSLGSILECNDDTSQPTVTISVLGNSETLPVSCTGITAGGLHSTSATGTLSAVSYTVVTGTTGPPCGSATLAACPSADSSGGNPSTDAAQYPCPPTTAQQAAGDSCVIAYGDEAHDQATATISFAGPCVAPAGANGYDMVAGDGGVFSFGTLPYCGSAGGTKLNKPVVGMALTHNGGGYWLVASDGGVFSYGNATFYGSAGGTKLNEPVVGMAATPDVGGYWLVASDGGVFAYGDAVFHGSAGGTKLNQPIVGMAATSDGGGYWLVASDGGVFAYGDAVFHGSAGGTALAKPIVGMAATSDGGGYWLVASDGGVFGYGDAVFHGSAGGTSLSNPIVAIAPTGDGGGYLLFGNNGGVLTYGDAQSHGSLGLVTLNEPIVGVASIPTAPA